MLKLLIFYFLGLITGIVIGTILLIFLSKAPKFVELTKIIKENDKKD